MWAKSIRAFSLWPPFLGRRVENIGRKGGGVSCFQINLGQNPSFPLPSEAFKNIQ